MPLVHFCARTESTDPWIQTGACIPKFSTNDTVHCSFCPLLHPTVKAQRVDHLLHNQRRLSLGPIVVFPKNVVSSVGLSPNRESFLTYLPNRGSEKTHRSRREKRQQDPLRWKLMACFQTRTAWLQFLWENLTQPMPLEQISHRFDKLVGCVGS